MHPTAVQHWRQLKGDQEDEWRDTPGIWFFCLDLGALMLIFFLLVFGRLRCLEARQMSMTDQTRRWSIKHATVPCMTRVMRTSFRSRERTMKKSKRCQCFDRGCIHVVMYMFLCRNRVLVITRSCSALWRNRRVPFELAFPALPCR